MMDLFQIITDRIVAELEQGVIPWQKPWSGAQGAISHTTPIIELIASNCNLLLSNQEEQYEKKNQKR